MKDIGISNEKKRKKYKKIGTKVSAVVIIIQMISMLLVMLLCICMYNSLVTKMQQDRCTNGTNMLAYELSRISEGQDVNAMLDELKSRMRCEFTIFEGDTRAYTTVIQNNARMIGTKLSADVSEIVLQKGNTYIGKADILGDNFLCSYVPTTGDDGKINGLIFAGISRKESLQETIKVIILSILIGVIAVGVSIILLSVYINKRVSIPLEKITKAAIRLEQGDLGLTNEDEVIRLDISSNDEIGVLAEIFENIIERLRSYIGEISNVLKYISNGDMTQGATQDYMGDFHSIKTSLDNIQSALNDTMERISTSAEQVSSGAEQVSSSSQSLSKGAADQASSVKEISSTVMEISEKAKQTAEAAQNVGEYLNEADFYLKGSISSVNELNIAMKNISDSSQKISTIIATIENIAFQINILALNAAVEASRAGAAGKGFSVVADEVRNLAAKSDEAAKATKELIEHSIDAVTEGNFIVSKVTDSLDKTSQSASQVTAQMSIVVNAVKNQTSAFSQVNEGISQISSVVQSNSETSEQCAAASEELSSLASLLKNLMRSFKLKDIKQG